ncbi:hypothetical protein FB45DRAFT_1038156 [Roridomyces roridus]|uniref:F-box domain-containing protein n=1 Tax=Roridomyces roridus TaxID=1738132 RepID=A0AAD7B434_9AGAR|nr:hypothetical protein FB45DRAFT_1038156 [Roridomyces roridus]
MSFADFPLDVVLELTKDLDLPDLLSLCAEVLSSPYFWISALTRMDRINRIPLPCAPGTDLTGLPLETLREMAVHACKLHRRWSSASPRPASVHAFDMDDDVVGDRVLYLFPIEGNTWSSPYQFHGSRAGTPTLDNVSGSGIVKTAPATRVCIQLTPLHVRESALMPLSSSSTRLKFTIVAMDHQTPSTVNVSPIFSKTWKLPPAGRSTSSVIVNAHTIGVVMSRGDPIPDSSRSLVFCRIRDGLLRQFPLPIESSTNSLDGLAVDDDFIIVGPSFTSIGPARP